LPQFGGAFFSAIINLGALQICRRDIGRFAISR
jgi:hypothetical protein